MKFFKRNRVGSRVFVSGAVAIFLGFYISLIGRESSRNTANRNSNVSATVSPGQTTVSSGSANGNSNHRSNENQNSGPESQSVPSTANINQPESDGVIDRPTENIFRWTIIAGLALSAIGLAACGFIYLSLRREVEGARRFAEDSLAQKLQQPPKQPASDPPGPGAFRREFELKLAEARDFLIGRIDLQNGRIDHLYATLLDQQDSDGQAAQFIENNVSEIVVEGPRLHLPTPSTVSQLLEWLRTTGIPLITAKIDMSRFTNLSKADDGPYLLADLNGDAEEWVLLPGVERFGGPQEFTIHYERFYECSNPDAGEIEIITPSIVEHDENQGGWKLRAKGSLQLH